MEKKKETWTSIPLKQLEDTRIVITVCYYGIFLSPSFSIRVRENVFGLVYNGAIREGYIKLIQLMRHVERYRRRSITKFIFF